MTGPAVDNPALNSHQNTEKSKWTCARWFNKISEAIASKTSRFFGHAVAAVVSVVVFIPSLAVDLVYAVKSLYDRKITKPKTMIQNQMPESAPQPPAHNQIPKSRPQTPAQYQMPKSRPQTPAHNQIPKSRPQTPTHNQIPKSRPKTPAQYQRPESTPLTPAHNQIPKSTPQTPAQYQTPKSRPQTPAQYQMPKSRLQTPAQYQMPESGSKTLTPNLPVTPETKVKWQRDIHDDDVRATMESYDRFLADNVSHHPEAIPKAAYRQLEKARDGDIPIELITQGAVKTVKLKKPLGAGASKVFYDTGDGQALAMNVASHQFYDELMMHTYLEKSGIPSIKIKPAVICWEFQGTKYSIATYIAPSFSEYAKQNAFALASKTSLEVFNQLNRKKVLSEGQEPFRLEDWDEALNPLVNDIRTLIDNGVSKPGDAINAILVGKGTQFHSGGPADYEVRAFPFDFSSKLFQYDRLPVKKQLTVEDEKTILKAYIKAVVFVQFDTNEFCLPKAWEDLVDQLVERYRRQ